MRQTQSPDWRRRRAVLLVDNNIKPSRSRDDRHVRRVWRFLKKRRQMDIRTDARLAEEMPDLHAAFEIFEATEKGTRWIFEASIMADRPVNELAAYLKTDIDVLHTYEIVFFDVRDALDAGGCIVSNILMPLTTHSILPRDKDVMWKALAFYGGWDVAKANWELDSATPAALDFISKLNSKKTLLNMFDGLHTARINSFNAHEHIRLGMDQNRQDFEMGNVSSGNQANAALNNLLDSIKMHVRETDSTLPPEEDRLQLPGPQHIIDADVVVEEPKKKKK